MFLANPQPSWAAPGYRKSTVQLKKYNYKIKMIDKMYKTHQQDRINVF